MTIAFVTPAHRQVVVMGVSGCGKTTLGEALAKAWDCEFVEGDRYHSPENVARMAAGIALTDEWRRDWLLTLADMLGQAYAQQRSMVLSCSALKRSYRDRLRAGDAQALFVHLEGSQSVIAARIAQRTHLYMPASLLDSQFAALQPPEPDEQALSLSVQQPPADLIQNIAHHLQAQACPTP